MTEKFDELYRAWISDLSRLGKEWCGEFQETIEGYVDSVMRDAFDPQRFMEFLRSSGVDFTGLLGTVRSQSAFDPYRILGLDKSASDEEVKRRYRELVHKLHPDTSGVDGTSCLLQIVMAAYEAIKRERGLK